MLWDFRPERLFRKTFGHSLVSSLFVFYFISFDVSELYLNIRTSILKCLIITSTLRLGRKLFRVKS